MAPAQAFCDALFARAPIALWIASRGFGGKTSLLALLAAANAILFETDVIILGGSGQQSARVVECLHRLLAAGQVPPAWLASAPTFTKTTFAWGNTIQALTASQTAVRGAHPTRLLLDGPYDPIGTGETASRDRIFGCRPEGLADEDPCAREILSTLARRAYRRPVTEALARRKARAAPTRSTR